MEARKAEPAGIKDHDRLPEKVRPATSNPFLRQSSVVKSASIMNEQGLSATRRSCKIPSPSNSYCGRVIGDVGEVKATVARQMRHGQSRAMLPETIGFQGHAEPHSLERVLAGESVLRERGKGDEVGRVSVTAGVELAWLASLLCWGWGVGSLSIGVLVKEGWLVSRLRMSIGQGWADHDASGWY